MGYESFSPRKSQENKVHPVWRGIGLVLLILTPILSFALADLAVQYVKLNVRGARIPKIFQPDISLPVYGMVYDWPLVLIITLLISLGLYSIFSAINALVYRVARDKTKEVFESDPNRFR